MDIHDFTLSPGEQPLDRLVPDGGFCGIFRTIGCVGDSLASGEFEAISPDGFPTYHDFFEHSWGQYLARITGSKVYNFSRGGMTAKEYVETFAAINDFWDPDKICSAYIMALGANDLFGLKQPVGSAADVDTPPEKGSELSFARYFIDIIARLKNFCPQARFFLMTMPREPAAGNEEHERIADAHAELMYEIAAKYRNIYVLDLRRYGPVYDADFKKKFFLHGHMNPCGYLLTAKMTASYIDYIIRSDLPAFSQVGFIGTQFYADEK